MKIKIISDGTSAGTKIVDQDTGEFLNNAVSVTWRISVHGTAVATVTLRDVPVDVVGEADYGNSTGQ
jgi:hypothetical protein